MAGRRRFGRSCNVSGNGVREPPRRGSAQEQQTIRQLTREQEQADRRAAKADAAERNAKSSWPMKRARPLRRL